MYRLLQRLPAWQWAHNYQPRWLRGDMIAGLTVAMMLIPQAMSYAMLAGLPAYVGLYASVVPLLVYALFGTSRQLAVGPVAMVALLVASGVGALAEPGSQQYISLAITLALMVGVIQLLMGVFGLGFLTNFMSHPVISGFTSAAAVIIGFSQLGALTGLSLPRSENVFLLLQQLFVQAEQIHGLTLAIGLSSILLLIGLKKWQPLLPGAMLVVVLSTLASWAFNLSDQGVKVVGLVPAGLPMLAMPELGKPQLLSLLPIALTIAFIGFLESIAVAKKIAREKRYPIAANQELIGLGLANIFGSFFKAMPVTGGFSRTAVNNSAGANTPLAAVITALIVALALLLLTPLFYHIPTVALAAVIVVAVANLIDAQEVRHLWQVKREDLALLGLSFTATLVLGVKLGILAAMLASMLWFIIKTTRPHYALLGQVPGSSAWRNLERHPQALPVPGVLAIRFDAQFYYGNVSFLQDILAKEQAKLVQPLRVLVLDASSINQLDSSADTALHELLRSYQEQGIELYLANVKGPVMDVLKRSGFATKLGADHFFLTINQAMEQAKHTLNSNAS